MRFRPCIDIHNGKVKQIVGGSLQDAGDRAMENFVSEQDAAYYARFYEKDDLRGGHIILLNPASSPYYDATLAQACLALEESPGRWQIGGGVTAENAASFLDRGATHVIVTSYVFREGQIDWKRLDALIREVGSEHLVLDVSCRRREDQFYVVTDRWQKFTDALMNEETLHQLGSYCDEFLVHAADVEGKVSGPEEEVLSILGRAGIPCVYAGGIRSLEDLMTVRDLGRDIVDVTIGSALDLFGGALPYEQVIRFMEES